MRRLIQAFGHLLTPAARRFDWALDHPQCAQARVQQAIVQRLMASQYGQSLGIQSIADWQRVPIVEYPDLAPWILPGERKSPLTPEPILFYEHTSGTRGAAKAIPYTRSLRRSFSHLFCVWAWDLLHHGPRFTAGKVYFCISPQLGEVPTSGLQDDSEYLDGWLRWLLSPFLVGISGSNRFPDGETFKRQLALALLREAALETISIWSPSFLTVLLGYIQTHREELRSHLRLSAKRDRLLQAEEILWADLWPELKLISCWESASAADPAAALRHRFPGVLVQGKGLLATEAPMTVPLIPAEGCLPLLDEVLLEFEDDHGQIYGLMEATVGQTYNLILSQKGGLYRYRIGDRVRLQSPYRHTPRLEFLGREQSLSDLVGEKLHATFVQDIFPTLPLAPTGFKSLVPCLQPQPHYLLLLDRCDGNSIEMGDRLEAALCQSPQYHHARQLGQLAPVQVWVHPQMPEILLQAALATGKKWGEVKYAALETRAINLELLKGRMGGKKVGG